ncbi:hypothetical protein RhiirA5_417431 [Rhizophagus irregularis]|uniref:Uncharacterized protein n=1 Tax=Rhizophagus irregularis TaxID=588596 RepID=A0A2N0PMH9_9GLOM|nr:hypothetical protein RhiirA5_417431 [Rhizophagus irregularis]PKC58817.1 hypothetical protein RhiirA1_470418 [Rhizophagus irregularis]
MEQEIFKYKDIIYNVILIFPESDAHWKNYIGRELDGGHKSSYDDTLKENKYIEVNIFTFQKYGCVEDLSLESGRSKILKVEDTKYLESLLKEKVDYYLWELQSEMEL